MPHWRSQYGGDSGEGAKLLALLRRGKKVKAEGCVEQVENEAIKAEIRKTLFTYVRPWQAYGSVYTPNVGGNLRLPSSLEGYSKSRLQHAVQEVFAEYESQGLNIKGLGFSVTPRNKNLTAGALPEPDSEAALAPNYEMLLSVSLPGDTYKAADGLHTWLQKLDKLAILRGEGKGIVA